MTSIIKSHKRVSLIVIIAFLTTSCWDLFHHGYIDEPFLSFLPGECLKETELMFTTPPNSVYVENRMGQKITHDYKLDFYIDLDTKVVWEEREKSHKTVPSDALFEQFGSNAPDVRRVYDNIFQNCAAYSNSILHSNMTVFYDGGMVLIADKDFAGIPAGENLIPFLWTIRNGYTASRWQESSADNKELWDQIPLAEGFTFEYMLPFELGGNLHLYFDVSDYEAVKEDISFTLSIPVRSVQYLTWINDCLSNPDAPMTWKDEVLTCSFTTGIRIK